MLEAFLKISPILATFALGYFLKKLKVFKADDGGLLLKLVFFVVSPALVYISTSTIKITPNLLAFPLIASLTMLVVYVVDVFVTKSFKVPAKTLGVYFVGTLIANTAFALPFLLATYGVEAVARVAMFDLAGGILTYTFVYSLAVKYGDQKPSTKFIIQKVLISPPVWALAVALLANFTNFQTPEIVTLFLRNLANLFSPLVMLALGFYFSPKFFHPKLISLGVVTRMMGGFVVGFILANTFRLSGIDRVVAIVCASAPIGFNTLTFSNMENLDSEFAASLVSIAIIIGLILIPVLTIVL